MIKALRRHAQELINLLSDVDGILADSVSLPDLEAAKALVELSRMTGRAEKVKDRLLSVATKVMPEAAASDT